MYKLNLAICFLLAFSCKVNAQYRKSNSLFISQEDTAYVSTYEHIDTVTITISLKIEGKEKQDYQYKMLYHPSKKKSLFSLLEKNLYGKNIITPIRNASYFANRAGNIKILYPKMIEEPIAFILNEKLKYSCLDSYKLQKNNYNGVVNLRILPDMVFTNFLLKMMARIPMPLLLKVLN